MQKIKETRDKTIILRESNRFMSKLDKLSEALHRNRSEVIRLAILMLEHEINKSLKKNDAQQILAEKIVEKAFRKVIREVRAEATAAQHLRIKEGA